MKTDPAYQTVSPDDFPAMLERDRYFRRSAEFEEIIARTEEHFWNPEDPDYIDFSTPMPSDTPVVPYEFVIESHTAVWDRLDEGQKLDFTNDSARWIVSNLLHGEQGALSLSASLCDIFLDPGAQEYAANQAREEARHVHGFSLYMQSRFGGDVFPVGETIGNLLRDIVSSPVVYKKIVGMQMLVEGLAMGAFTTLHKVALDPTLRRLCQLVMTDEAFHHRFGKIWAHNTVPRLDSAEQEAVEDWAKDCFNLLLLNMVNAEQRKLVYPRYGLDWQWVRSAVQEAVGDDQRREAMGQQTNVFRVLTKTLDKAGMITERTRDNYGMWMDIDALQQEDDRMVGDDIAEEGIRDLIDINSTKRKIVKKIS